MTQFNALPERKSQTILNSKLKKSNFSSRAGWSLQEELSPSNCIWPCVHEFIWFQASFPLFSFTRACQPPEISPWMKTKPWLGFSFNLCRFRCRHLGASYIKESPENPILKINWHDSQSRSSSSSCCMVFTSFASEQRFWHQLFTLHFLSVYIYKQCVFMTSTTHIIQFNFKLFRGICVHIR